MQAHSSSKNVLEAWAWTTAYDFPESTSLTLRLLKKVTNVDIVIPIISYFIVCIISNSKEYTYYFKMFDIRALNIYCVRFINK